METYVLKTIACLFVFWAFYKLFLENLGNHLFKRWFLLLSVLAAFIIPSVVFTSYVAYAPQAFTSTQLANSGTMLQEQITSAPATDMETINWGPLLLTTYVLGVIVFGFRFIKNLRQIVQRIRHNTKLKDNSGTKVLLKRSLPPHTFFSYIFLNKKKYETNSIPKEVLLHEEVHAKQLHSIDVVLIELLQVFFWFNPVIYLLKNTIKLNHEFLADSAVIKTTLSPKTYQNTLLSYLSKESENKYQSIKMANAITYSSTRLTVFGQTFEFGSAVGQVKKRFKIMKKQSSRKAVLLRSILIIPLFALLLYGFSETKFIQVPQEENKEILGKQDALAESSTENSLKNGSTKKFILLITDSQIILNDKKVPLASFAKTVNALTKDWEETEYTSIPVQANFSNTPMAFIAQVEYEFHKTHFSKPNEGMRIFPVGYQQKGKQEGASRKLMAEYNTLAKKYNEMDRDRMRISGKDVERLTYIYGLMSGKQKEDAEPFPDFPEPPPAPAPPNAMDIVPSKHTIAPKGKTDPIAPAAPKTIVPSAQKKTNGIPKPPKPPKPIAPVDHIIAMAKKGATFYFEGKEVSSDRAIELLKKNKSLNISTTKSKSKNPQVRITKSPVRIKKSSAATGLETGNTTVNGKALFYSKKNGVVSYFNEEGAQVDEQGKPFLTEQKHKPTFYFNGNKISSVKAHQLLRNNTSIQVTNEEYTENEYAIVLTDLNSVSYTQNLNKNNNPNSVIDFAEMITKKASFFYNDQPVSVEKARWLTENEYIERVQVIGSKNGTPKVYFWKKA